MRWSKYFIPTTKETPKDATAASHKLMLRSGMIRQLAAGIYSYLPVGYATLRKVENIVREEMNRAGAVELHMPVLQPLSLWKRPAASMRWAMCCCDWVARRETGDRPRRWDRRTRR